MWQVKASRCIWLNSEQPTECKEIPLQLGQSLFFFSLSKMERIRAASKPSFILFRLQNKSVIFLQYTQLSMAMFRHVTSMTGKEKRTLRIHPSDVSHLSTAPHCCFRNGSEWCNRYCGKYMRGRHESVWISWRIRYALLLRFYRLNVDILP